jgi:predicted RNase H-like HicB family nuclease
MKDHRNITAELPVLFLKEGAQYVAYTPALDLSTCGDTFEQARRRFAEAVAAFIEQAVEMGTLDDVLQSV